MKGQAVGFAPLDRIRMSGIEWEVVHMAKKSRGGRITAAKKRAAKAPGGKGLVKKRKVGLRIMKT
jgi:hypothetical protein